MALSSCAKTFSLAKTADQETFRVDQHDSRPGLHPVSVPDTAVGVVDDRMADFVAEHRFLDALGVFLAVELGRVDADDDELVRILLFQPDQVGNDVYAVNSAERPEIEDDDFAAQVGELERLVGADPADAAVEICGPGSGGLSRGPRHRSRKRKQQASGKGKAAAG